MTPTRVATRTSGRGDREVSQSSTDRRTHERRAVAIEFEGVHPEHGVVARMTASNLSLGGIHCTSTRDFPEMTRLAVRMVLPNGAGGSPIDLEAVVVRREAVSSPSGGPDRFHLALFFTRIEDDHKTALADFLTGHA